MRDYESAPIFQKIPDARNRLHAFFSSWRVPVGLTDKEVAVCVRLHPYRKRMLEVINTREDAKLARRNLPQLPEPTFGDAVHLIESEACETIADATEYLDYAWSMMEHMRRHPIRIISLPQELSPSTVMTRERFRAGIRAFIAEYRNVCET